MRPDSRLAPRSFSYELQRRLGKATVQNPFHESVEVIADLTGVAVSEQQPGGDPTRCRPGF
jgi:hypothetical protein